MGFSKSKSKSNPQKPPVIDYVYEPSAWDEALGGVIPEHVNQIFLNEALLCHPFVYAFKTRSGEIGQIESFNMLSVRYCDYYISIKHGWWPVAGDESGNYYLVSLSDPNEDLLFYDHENEDTTCVDLTLVQLLANLVSGEELG